MTKANIRRFRISASLRLVIKDVVKRRGLDDLFSSTLDDAAIQTQYVKRVAPRTATSPQSQPVVVEKSLEPQMVKEKPVRQTTSPPARAKPAPRPAQTGGGIQLGVEALLNYDIDDISVEQAEVSEEDTLLDMVSKG